MLKGGAGNMLPLSESVRVAQTAVCPRVVGQFIVVSGLTNCRWHENRGAD